MEWIGGKIEWKDWSAITEWLTSSVRSNAITVIIIIIIIIKR